MSKTGAVPESVRTEIVKRLRCHALARWPKAKIEVSWRGRFAYVGAVTSTGSDVKLCRLGYTGSTEVWEFAFSKYSSESYGMCFLPSGSFAGSPEECLDCAGIYLDQV